ncbi:DUF1805 domain-containing protein [Alicyclobacillus cycloheptanicus]|uniref:Uncharacterized protein YunC (DUF1805 family) n=1 Tax=Alicyclobacillus cycloheptanicus TaxID=1457 RepID=A0ABT9XGX9_9BACL|nr:DUF1805 domain-containing protein [Alicyclobacillus cycloheptanicus]MDQ0189001.1 uncharacterized protein YunC (DUF1805 family) [Alicyclobacillus cycloheptanicus]WDM01658.1 DUF1805 domain-containing protein [Alicyclobacillus cycloheptanicus]
MVHVQPIWIDHELFLGTEVQLPKTTLLVIQSDTGYVMCGALDVQLLREKLASRNILAARATGVRNLQELLDGTVESCTQAAEALGIEAGTPIREALLRMRAHERAERG